MTDAIFVDHNINAYKLLLWDSASRELLIPATLTPWPKTNLALFTCSQGHGVPTEGCTCGIYATLDAQSFIKEYKRAGYPYVATHVSLYGVIVVEHGALRAEMATIRGVCTSEDFSWKENYKLDLALRKIWKTSRYPFQLKHLYTVVEEANASYHSNEDYYLEMSDMLETYRSVA